MSRTNGEGDDAWNTIEPEGLAMALLVSSGLFAGVTTVIMAMRVYIRVVKRNFGTDDWMMVGGYFATLGQDIITIYGAHWGLGTRDAHLLRLNQMHGKMSLIIWQFFYSLSLSLVKGSICVTLMRIATARKYLVILKTLIIFSFVLSGVGIVVLFNQCHPLESYWDSRVPGTCIPPIILTVLSVAASVVNVMTDFTVALIPFFLLRNVQMRPRIKFYIRAILAMGLLAGVASIVRVPFTNAYTNPTDLLYNTGNIVLWTIIECGLGIIAGSLPTLRAFFKKLAKDYSSGGGGGASGPSNRQGSRGLVTIGQIKGRHNPVYDTELQVTVVGMDDLGRRRRAGDDAKDGDGGDDSESTRRIIRVTKDVHQTVESDAATPKGRGSPV
ncbi:hypothetical protein RB595_003314 [Gaeumannomyces hyphopodioides]